MALDAERLAAEAGSLLFTHSSRCRFAARLNSGVRPPWRDQWIRLKRLWTKSSGSTRTTILLLLTNSLAESQKPGAGSVLSPILTWCRAWPSTIRTSTVVTLTSSTSLESGQVLTVALLVTVLDTSHG